MGVGLRDFSFEKFAVKNSIRRSSDKIGGVPSAIIQTRFNPPAQVVQPPGSWAAYLHLDRLGLAVSADRMYVRGGRIMKDVARMSSNVFMSMLTWIKFGIRSDLVKVSLGGAVATAMGSWVAATKAS